MVERAYLDPDKLDVDISAHEYVAPLSKLCEACDLRPATHWISVKVSYTRGVLCADLCAECLLKSEVPA